jgi:Signal transduction histidine kinase regulating C4-dicarboxylate transport system
LLQAQKMEAIGTLAGGIAHDFNNILAGIFGYAQLAEIHINQPEKAKEHIAQVIKSGQRAAALIRQILTFSRQSEFKPGL